MTTEITTAGQPRTAEEWDALQLQIKSENLRLDVREIALREDSLMKILEVASQEIDRFGWQMMDKGVKDDIFENWCDELEPYSLNKIKSAIRLLFKKSKGNLRTINAFQVIGAIDEINHAERAKLPKAPKEQEATRSAPDDKQKARIAALVRGAFPQAQTAQQIEDGKA